MIRKFEINDLDKIMEIWLKTNTETHSFIDKSYWESNYDMVKEMMPQAEIYVFEENKNILGFIGLMDNYIAGIFIKKSFQSKGIGKQLLDYVKRIKENLTLQVYEKNEKAVKFYKKENFVIQSEDIDKNITEKEFVMYWKK